MILFDIFRRVTVGLRSAWLVVRAAVFRHRISVGSANRVHAPLALEGAGRVSIGDGNSFGYHLAPRLGDGRLLLQPRAEGAVISIGSRNAFSNNVAIVAMSSIAIGHDCLCGDQVTITDCDFHPVEPHLRHVGHGQVAPVSIGNNVWIGSRSMILKGVSLGDNVVVGAMSVVTRSFPANVLIAGAPAKVVRSLAADERREGRPLKA
jgi:maltose O-acetyltransferase